MTKGKVLVIGSNATRIELQGGGWASIGQYLNEVVVPVTALINSGYDVVLATPDGTKPRIDKVSDAAEHFGGDEAALTRAKTFYADDPSMNRVHTLRSVIDDALDGYAGVFVPGGHAPAVDLMQDPDLGTILRHFHKVAKPTALLCHGPVAATAAMPNARAFRSALVAGDMAKATECASGWIYEGYKMTVFSASEEKTAEDNLLHGKLYFDMPAALRTAGAEVSTNPADSKPYLVTDRELITAQNPTSDHLVATALIEALNRSRAA